MTITRIALATCAALPQGDPDDELLARCLRERGASVSWEVWDRPAVRWEHFAAVVLRSTWDYQLRRSAFIDWAAGVPNLINTAAVVAWNSDKRYLGELRQVGLPTVPTVFVAPGAPLPLLEALGEVVVKPSVSAGSKDTARFDATDAAGIEALRTQISSTGRTTMIQPYIPSVDEQGETALVYIGGRFSHAVRKGPLLRRSAPPTDELFAPEKITRQRPTSQERDVADQCFGFIVERHGPLAYARIDLVADDDGAPLVLELELTEPSLFLRMETTAAEALAEAVMLEARGRLRGGSGGGGSN